MNIRPIIEPDKQRWLLLFQAYIAYYGDTVESSVVELTFERLILGTFCGWVAVDADDKPIGLVHAVFHPSTWSDTDYCYLEDLFVSPPWRHRGVGRRLIETVYRAADARGCTRTYWVTHAGNTEAQALYDRLAIRSSFVQYRRDQ